MIARGQGSSVCMGHPDSWLEDITIDNLNLYLSLDPSQPYDRASNALKFQYVKNLKLHNVEIHWGEPASPAGPVRSSWKISKGWNWTGLTDVPRRREQTSRRWS